MGRPEHARIVLAQPHQFVHRVHGVQRHAGDVEDALFAQPLAPPTGLLASAGVNGGDETVDGPALRVHRHNGFAVRGHAQRPHRIGSDGGRHLADDAGHRRPDLGRVQLHPAGLRLVEAILAVGLSKHIAFGTEGHRLAARDADVQSQ